MEALSKELDEGGRPVDKSNLQPGRKVNAGYYVGHHLVQVFGISEPPASSLVKRLEDLFQDRNDAVHFESLWQEGVHPHPTGTDTAYEMTVYTLERAVAALDLVEDVLVQIHRSVQDSRHDPSANHVAQEISGVLKMFREVRGGENI